MNKTQLSQFVDVVNGTVIGDMYSTGQLFNEGRPQGPRFIGNDDEIRQKAQAYADRLKTQLGAEYRRLYPNGMELRIWD